MRNLQNSALTKTMMYSMRREPLVLLARRLYATSAPRLVRNRHLLRTTTLVVSTISGAAVLGLYSDASSCPPPPFQLAGNTGGGASPDLGSRRDVSPPLPKLLRTYFVYAVTSCEALVDHAPEMLDTLFKVPLLRTVVEGVVRLTFFDHFVGGETARAALPLLATLRNQNKGALFAYSVEVDAHEAAGASGHHNDNEGRPRVRNPPEGQPVHKRIVAEMIRSIDVAADFEDEWGTRDVTGRRTWVAVKLTALLPNADTLRKLSLHLTHTRPVLSPPVPFPGSPESSDLLVLQGRMPRDSPLTAQDVEDLKELYHDLNRICTRAQDRYVRIIIDAEHSWYQPAIDAFGHALMKRFNALPDHPKDIEAAKLQPIVYVTYQAYLRRTPIHLARSLALARQDNYALGVKLVRGAYHLQEVKAYSTPTWSTKSGSIGISPDPHPPVHSSKPDTDTCYNECACLLVRAIADDVKSFTGNAPRVGVLFGTHNWVSSELILGELVKNDLARQEVSGTNAGHKGAVITVQTDVASRLTFGQLYGMSDSLTDYLVGRIQSTTPCVVKYIPYGALVEVMPYISRRAIENKSVLGNGGAVRERKEAARQIWTRIFGGIGL